MVPPRGPEHDPVDARCFLRSVDHVRRDRQRDQRRERGRAAGPAAGRGAAARRGHPAVPPAPAMTRWIVDGMNVIGSRPTGWWRDRPGAMRGLVSDLGEFAARGGDEVTVVFDAKPFELEGDGVRVMFAGRRGPNAADDDIAALVGGDPAPG